MELALVSGLKEKQVSWSPGPGPILVFIGIKMTLAKLSSESMEVSDWKEESFEESEPSSRDNFRICRTPGRSLFPPLEEPEDPEPELPPPGSNSFSEGRLLTRCPCGGGDSTLFPGWGQ